MFETFGLMMIFTITMIALMQSYFDDVKSKTITYLLHARKLNKRVK